MGNSTRQQDDRYHVHPEFVYFAFPGNAFNLKVIVSGPAAATEMMGRRCWPSRLEAQSGEWFKGSRDGKKWLPSQKQNHPGQEPIKQSGVSPPESWEPGWSEETLGILCIDNQAHHSVAGSCGSGKSNQVAQCPGRGRRLHPWSLTAGGAAC